jgi:hypothetical protein
VQALTSYSPPSLVLLSREIQRGKSRPMSREHLNGVPPFAAAEQLQPEFAGQGLCQGLRAEEPLCETTQDQVAAACATVDQWLDTPSPPARQPSAQRPSNMVAEAKDSQAPPVSQGEHQEHQVEKKFLRKICFSDTVKVNIKFEHPQVFKYFQVFPEDINLDRTTIRRKNRETGSVRAGTTAP